MEKVKEKKQGLFKCLEKSKKAQLLFFVVSMCMIVVVYLFVDLLIDRTFEIVEDDFSWVYQIDSVQTEEDELVLKGWAFKLREDAQRGNCDIILRDIVSGEIYYSKMSYLTRTDVNDYFLCEYDYSRVGFVSRFSLKELDLKEEIYEILLKPSNARHAFATGNYYSDGKIKKVLPNDYVPLETKGTDLEVIVEEGILLVYNVEQGMYVYQYKSELYWIADEYYQFVNDNILVQFHMDTTQASKLPQDRLDNGWYWSNISFWFKSKELVDMNTGRYRVAKCQIPTEYSISKIWTGNYHADEWLWKYSFRPKYEFNIEEN